MAEGGGMTPEQAREAVEGAGGEDAIRDAYKAADGLRVTIMRINNTVGYPTLGEHKEAVFAAAGQMDLLASIMDLAGVEFEPLAKGTVHERRFTNKD